DAVCVGRADVEADALRVEALAALDVELGAGAREAHGGRGRPVGRDAERADRREVVDEGAGPLEVGRALVADEAGAVAADLDLLGALAEADGVDGRGRDRERLTRGEGLLEQREDGGGQNEDGR